MERRGKKFRLVLTRWSLKLVSMLIVLFLTFQASGMAFAEGSRDLYPSGASGSRGDLEWRTSSYGPAGSTLLRRTLLRVFANAGEVILVGSSAVGVVNAGTTGNILVYNPGLVTGSPGTESVPGVASFSCLTQRTATGNANQGQITSRSQELAGPDTITNPATATRGNAVANSYVPCFYTAPSTGIYNVVIYGPSGFSSDAQTFPTGEVALASAANFNNSQSTNVAAWDVTVRGSLTSTTDITGRLFTFYLAQITGGNGRPLNSSLYVVTLDGFIYLTDLKGMDPFGFLSYGSNAGFYNSDGTTPLYHDVLSTVGASNPNQLTQLQGGVSMARPQFPIFFNPPDPAVLTALGIPTTPGIPILNTFNFSGTAGGFQSYFGTGGSFSFNSNTTGFFDIIVSKNGVGFDPTDPQNRVIHALGHLGLNTISWDGRDNSGKPFPIGTYSVRSTIHAGELHMELIDAENSAQGGPSYTLTNPPGGNCTLAHGCSTAFYDDRGYQTLNGSVVGTVGSILCGTNPPFTSSAVVDGFDSTTSQRAFGTASGGNAGTPCLGSFGDTKGLDLWTYFPSEAVIAVVVVIAPPPPPQGPSQPPSGGGSGDPNRTYQFVIPVTGFAPDKVTRLPEQAANQSYSQLGSLWLEIPSQGVKENIVGVPAGANSWDVSWLGNDIGYLEGTAFPTLPGNSSLAAHVYNSDGKPGPFINIGKLNWGSRVIVHAWGQNYVYEVRTVANWVNPTNNFLINKHEDRPWVTLITCRGYDKLNNTYLYRTIVRAVLVSIESDN